QFLHADAEARRKLLEKLFGTDRFRAVEDWLAERRRATAADVAAAGAQLDQLLARIAQVAGVPVPAEADPSSEVLDGGAPGIPWQVAWAGELRAAAEASQGAAASVSAARGQELAAAQLALNAADRLASRQRRRAEAVERQASLEAASPSIE